MRSTVTRFLFSFDHTMEIIMKKFIRPLAFVCVLGAIMACVAQAQVKSMSAEELAQRADVVAVGKVTSSQPEWSADGKRILTRVTIGVDQSLKGNDGVSAITVEVPGGEIGTV